ncbi:MFS transporter [Sediminibacillus massiliensis]|uniref:MFS transporter n=1 Tax=Sediminibacillus massiliensis TaxID=1926277 RepID=UPI0009885DA5|nr:MFS transporter [Sediminibacillus massiliensis]
MAEKQNKIWTKDFISISTVNFLVFTIFYTLITTLPLYVIADLGGTEAQGGLIVTAMLLAAILMRPLSGGLLERFGKRNILIAGTVLFTLTTFGYIFIDQFTVLLALRFIHGLSFGVLTTAAAAIAADVVPVERQGEGLGYFTMSMNLAVVAGPFIGLSLLQFVSFQTLFIILSIVIILSVLCGTAVKVSETVPQTSSTNKKKWTFDDFLERRAFPIGLIGSLVAISYSGILSFISVYASANGLESVSSYFFLVFAVTMLLTRPSLGRLFDRRGPKVVILPCLVLFAVGLVVLSFAQTAVLLLLSAALIGIGYGSLVPFLLSLAVKSAPAKRNGYVTATFFTLFDTGIAVGSFLLGLIVTYTGFSLLFILSAVLVLVTTVAFYVMFTSTRRTNPDAVEIKQSS